MGGDQEANAARAAWLLAEAGQPPGVLLRDKLLADDDRGKEIKRLIADLDNDSWKTREEATVQLKALGPLAGDLLRQTAGQTKSEEVKVRIRDIMADPKVSNAAPPNRLRAARGVKAIESLGGPQALACLRQLSQDSAPAVVRWYARGAYWRLAEKSIEGLLDEADRQAKEGNFTGAAATCDKAAALAKSALPAEEAIIAARLKRYAAKQPADAQPRWLEMLDLVKPDRHAVRGVWSKNEAGLAGGKELYETIMLPVAPDGDYHVRLKFCRISGEYDCIALLPAGKGVARAGFCFPDTAAAIVNADGPFPFNADCLPPGGWVNGVEYTADLIVRLDGDKATVQVFVNGSPSVDWSGKQEDLTVVSVWEIKTKSVLAVGATYSPTVFREAKLRMLSGKVKIVDSED